MTSLATLLGMIPHGAWPRGRQRTIRSAGPRHHRRTRRFSHRYRLPGAGRLSHHSQPGRRNRQRRRQRHESSSRQHFSAAISPSADGDRAKCNGHGYAAQCARAHTHGAGSRTAQATANPDARAGGEHGHSAQSPGHQCRQACSRWRSIRSCARHARRDLPLVTGSITASQAEDGSRVSAGDLSAPRGCSRTRGQAGASRSSSPTSGARTISSPRRSSRRRRKTPMRWRRLRISSWPPTRPSTTPLRRRPLSQVAGQTVDTRQTTETQVNQMTQNKLKSTLDLSFADVDLSQARLLQLDAQNNADATMAALDAILGLDHTGPVQSGRTHRPPQPPPDDASRWSNRTASAARPAVSRL